MKIQCACGTKYAFDVTPEMARAPIQFTCQNCGLDISATINQLIRQELGVGSASVPLVAPPVVIAPPPPNARIAAPAVSVGAVPQVVPVSVASNVSPPPPAAAPALRVSVAGHSAAASGSAALSTPASEPCAKHPGQAATHRCMVCDKPMCPKCMEVFGFVCSGYCKGKAETQGIFVPQYGGTKARAESKQWRRAGLLVAAVLIAFFVVMGAWGWYAWIGSVPKVAFSLRFPEAGYSGQVRFNPQGQAVFLHGGRLVRHDAAAKKEIWSNLLLDKKKIADEGADLHKRMVAEREKGIQAGVEYTDLLPTLAEVIDGMEQAAAAAMHLHVRGENVWVSLPDKLVRFDWQSGKSAQEIPLRPGEKRLVSSGDELLVELVQQAVTRVNLVSGEARTEELRNDVAPATAPRLAAKVAASAASSSRPPEAVRSQNLSTPARAVLPVVNAATANQQRMMSEMNTSPSPSPGVAKAVAAPAEPGDSRLIVSRNGVFQLSARAGTKAVDGARVHQVTLRRMSAQPNTEWTGELPGFPELHPLTSVYVLAAGKSVLVLDKSNQKRWEARLTQAVPAPARPPFLPENSLTGEGPCVERADTLYIYDSATLTAFDLANGNVRWRCPTADTTGLFFDDEQMIYVNGITTGSDKAQNMVTKVDAKTGKQLWRIEREGSVSYVSGKFVYTSESYRGDDDEADGIVGANTIFHVPAFLRIKRLDPANGRLLWNHHQPRCPLDVQFDKTTIQLLFKKELQTLTFLSL